MAKKRALEEEVNALLRSLDDPNNNQRQRSTTDDLSIHPGLLPPPDDQEPLETYHIYPMGEGLFITKTPLQEDEPESIEAFTDSIPAQTPPTKSRKPTKEGIFALITCILALSLVCFNISQALYLVFLQSVTVTIIPVTHTLTTTQTFQIVENPHTKSQIQGQLFTPLALSQSVTVPATGHAHQSAQQASGTITFYNGLVTPQTVEAGTTLTTAVGTQITTDQVAIIPPATQSIPPTYGQTSVPAHAVLAGSAGNIARGDINQTCCGESIQVQNPSNFIGGIDARDYTTVTQHDITNTTFSLATSLEATSQAALNAQTHPGNTITSHCANTVQTNHQVGQEATQLTVSVQRLCSAAEFDTKYLQQHIAEEINTASQSSFGHGTTLFSEAHTTTLHTNFTPNHQVFIQVRGTGTTFYQPDNTSLLNLKKSIAGKTGKSAQTFLTSLPWTTQVKISGLPDNNSRLPSDPGRIHLLFLILTV
jgi:hypothetical protein